MSRPWMKFYPSDWRADPALRMCSLAARGLWMEMLCIMHEAQPRGFLLVNGHPVSDRQLASLCGISAREVAGCLIELEAAGVFSRDDAQTIYSRRMQRDELKAERDKHNGKAGGNPKLRAGVNHELKAQIPDTRSQNPEEERKRAIALDGEFEKLWEIYPKRDGRNPKKPARNKLSAYLRAGIEFPEIIDGAKRYADHCESKRIVGTPYVAQLVTWLNQESWRDYGPALAKRESVEIVFGTTQWDAWRTYYRDTGRKFAVRLMDAAADQGRKFTVDSQYPPTHKTEAA